MPHTIHSRRFARFAGTVVLGAACSTPLAAEPFCDNVRAIAAAAPQFASLRGAPEGMGFDGTLVLEGAAQCKIRNKSDLDDNWQPVNEKFEYECLWEDRSADAFAALSEMMQMCLPEAKFSTGSQLSGEFANFTGNTLLLGDVSVIVDYNKD